MKLSNNKFKCEWCSELTIKNPLKGMEGRSNISLYGQVICPHCGRHISQKTKLEMTK